MQVELHVGFQLSSYPVIMRLARAALQAAQLGLDSGMAKCPRNVTMPLLPLLLLLLVHECPSKMLLVQALSGVPVQLVLVLVLVRGVLPVLHSFGLRRAPLGPTGT